MIKEKDTLRFTRSKYYRAWLNMKYRCENPRNKSYARYGGRGIKICKRWRNVFLYKEDIDKQLKKQGLFLKDWGRGLGKYTMDRKDNDGDYEPSNIRFATIAEQANNRKKGKVLPKPRPRFKTFKRKGVRVYQIYD